MATFPAQYYTYATRYPQSGPRVELARSYTWSAEPDSPDARVFLLTLAGMQYFLDGSDLPDRTTQTGRNLWVLEDFYTEHRLWKSFTLAHPVYGNLTCKFNRPLEVPEGISGGNGVVPPFEVELIEQP